jgi:hypothetical protein
MSWRGAGSDELERGGQCCAGEEQAVMSWREAGSVKLEVSSQN